MLRTTGWSVALIGNIRQRGATSSTRSRAALSSSFSLSASDVLRAEANAGIKSADDDYTSRIRRQKYDDLLNSINRERPNPSRAWGYYVDLLDFLELEKLPLELHQLVLRKCVPPASELRVATARRMQLGNAPKLPHMYESRLRAVIGNIRAAGWKPSIDDYHFILSQFAAVGHHVGAARVLDEMRKMGVEPRTKTYGLCLQAIAHRLCIPCPLWKKDQVLDECVQLSMRVLEGIRDNGTPITSVNLDLAMRIIKEAGRSEAFESLLRIGYGIDLSFPDHHPIDANKLADASVDDISPWKGPSVNRQPLTASMLTTIVDFYGQHKQLSRMVQLFEVLSNPLPPPNPLTKSPAVDEEDEDDFPLLDASSIERPLPSAKPNTTTFNTIIRHCAKSGHDILGRHYLLLAFDTDRTQIEQLKEDISSKSFSDFRPPTVLVNREALLPLVGLANRNKDRELMKWVMGQNRRIWKQKRIDLAFCRAVLEEKGVIEISADVPDSEIPGFEIPGSEIPGFEIPGSEIPVGVSAEALDVTQSDNAEVADSSAKVSFFTPSSPPPQPLAPNMEVHPLDLDPESSETPPSIDPSTNMPRNPFDLQLHVNLLRHDIVGLAVLDKTIGTSMTRICDRTKEKIGRRVWAEKNVFLARLPDGTVYGSSGLSKSAGTRTKLSRDTWTSIVNFGGRKRTDGKSSSSSVDSISSKDASLKANPKSSEDG